VEPRKEEEEHLENQKSRDHLEDVGVDRKVILKWILRK
jgi:hypothetical protein